MRLTTVILIVSLMQVSAVTLGQRITMSQKNVPLSVVLKEIRKQSGYDVLYDRGMIPSNTKVSVDVKNASVEDALAQTLKGLDFAFDIDEKVITIKKNTSSLLDKAKSVILNLVLDLNVRGKVLDEKGEPLVGATVSIKGTGRSVKTNDKGEFYLENVAEDDKLLISYVGYHVREVDAASELGSWTMSVADQGLEEINVVSTGYQTLDKSKVTGSVTVVDNKLLNRAVSPDLLSRLKDVTNGLLIDNRVAGPGNTSGLSVRGRSTLFSNTKPLIVIDNFPFEGDLNAINPNDIESVSILKDAASAAIWGVRAGNGVIVLTTKKGKLNKKTTVGFNSNITMGDREDLFYARQITSADYIELEKFLFSQGAYTAPLRNNWSLISPVVQLLSKRNTGNAAETDLQIEQLKSIDSRKDIDKYFNRSSLKQQYFLDVNGGGEHNTYNISGGFDLDAPTQVAVNSSRSTLRANNTYDFFNHKLKLTSDITFVHSVTDNRNATPYTSALFPYEGIVDGNGNPLAVLRTGGLRAAYTDTAGNGRLLDWKYKPLEELNLQSNTVKNESTDLRMNTGMSYQVLKGLEVSANYQHFRSIRSNENLRDITSFQARNAINTSTQINPATGVISYPMPMGGHFTKSGGLLKANYGRVQVNYQATFGLKHELNAIGGYEIRSEKGETSFSTLFGYDPDTRTSIFPDNVNSYKNYFNNARTRYTVQPYRSSETTNNNVSTYLNLNYAYNSKYVLSGSYRKDESNLFGVKANQKGVPLWSAGASWNVAKEDFYHLAWLPQLQLRASLGYNGNVNQNVTAYTTALVSNFSNIFSSPFLDITNPPNPSLRWERIKNQNVGLDFTTAKGMLSGSVELYSKKGKDLIGASPVAQQTGVLVFTGNFANTETKGMDLQLNSKNFDGVFKWYSSGFLNLAKNKVTNYMANTGSNYTTVSTNLINPIVGYPIGSLFSFRSTKLDDLGNPQGFLNNEISQDYAEIQGSTNIEDLIFHGSTVPTVSGGLINTFSYSNFEVSVNISYKLNYYFRRSALQYNGLFNGGTDLSGEYQDRWQASGDEDRTNVPSLIYPADFSRDEFYAYSESTVEKGDHIRLNDVKLSYLVPAAASGRIGFRSLSFYVYANNIGVLWRKNNRNLDPDLGSFGSPIPKSIAFGLSANF